MISGTGWISEVVWLIVTGDYEGTARKQEERIYYIGAKWADLKKADSDQQQRILCVSCYQKN